MRSSEDISAWVWMSEEVEAEVLVGRTPPPQGFSFLITDGVWYRSEGVSTLPMLR